MTFNEFIELFKINSSAYATQNPNGTYTAVKDTLTEDMFKRHAEGSITLGTYTVSKDNTTNFTLIDVDKVDKAEVTRILGRCSRYGISTILEFSGKKGYHIIVPFSSPISAWKARNLGLLLSQDRTYPHEVFPKQDFLREGQLGSLIKVPLGIHRVTGKRSWFLDESFNPVKLGETKISYTTETQVDDIIKDFARQTPIRKDNGKVESKYPCNDAMYSGINKELQENISRNHIGFKLACRLYKSGVPRMSAEKMLLDWNRKNNPPMDDAEVVNCVSQGYTGLYGAGCTDPMVVDHYCLKEQCNIYNSMYVADEDIDLSAEELVPESGIIRNYIEYARKRNDAPLQYHIMMGLQLMNVLVRDRVWFVGASGRKTMPNIYSLMLGDSGVGKSTALDTVTKIINDVDPSLLFPNNFASTQAFLDSMSVVPNGSLVLGELEEFLAKHDSDSYLTIMTYLYDCPDSYQQPARTVEPIHIDKPKLSMLTACTPYGLTNYLKESDIRNGFFVRFAVVYAHRVKNWEFKMETQEMRDMFEKLCLESRNIYFKLQPREADFSLVIDKLNDYVRKSAKELDGNHHAYMLAGFYTRLNVYVVKFAMLLQVSIDGSTVITEYSLQMAINIVEYLKKTIRYIVMDQLSFSGKHRNLIKVRDMVYETGSRGISKKVLLKDAKISDSRDLESIVRTLMDRGDIEVIPLGNNDSIIKRCSRHSV